MSIFTTFWNCHFCSSLCNTAAYSGNSAMGYCMYFWLLCDKLFVMFHIYKSLWIKASIEILNIHVNVNERRERIKGIGFTSYKVEVRSEALCDTAQVHWEKVV